MARHSGTFMMKPGHAFRADRSTVHFNRPDYMPVVERTVAIGSRPGPMLPGETEYVYYGTWIDASGTVIAETMDGYDTPQSALRSAGASFYEATDETRKFKVLPPHRDADGNSIVVLTDDERGEAQHLLNQMKLQIDYDLGEGSEKTTYLIVSTGDDGNPYVLSGFDSIDSLLDFVLNNQDYLREVTGHN